MASKKPTTRARAAKPRAAAATPPAHTSPLADFCRSLPGATEDIKWGDHLMFSIGAKIFAGFDLDDSGQLRGPFGFKCDDADFDRLTDIDGIVPAPYAARFGWVKVTRRGVLPDAELRQLLRKSYDLVLARLPARVRKQIAAAP